MAKRNLYGRKQNPFKILLYIVAVLLLLGGIAYLVMCSREKKESFQQQIKTMEADETEYAAPPREKETETESEAEKQTSASDEKKPSAIGENDKKETDAVTETESETETETESEPMPQAAKEKQILLLNASGSDGVAARWKTKLTREGYKKVAIASYPGSSIEQTRIYVKEEAEADEIKKLFAQPWVTTDEFTARVEDLPDSVEDPEDIEIYIVIGIKDK